MTVRRSRYKTLTKWDNLHVIATLLHVKTTARKVEGQMIERTTDRKQTLGQKDENEIIQAAYWPIRLKCSLIKQHLA